MYYINENVKELNRIFDQNLRQGNLRMDLNENPGGLPVEFIKKTLEGITPEFVAQYPETLPFTEALAKFLDVAVENLCLVNGSAEGVRYIIEAFSRPGGKVLGVTPSYAMYKVYSDMYGREFVPIEYDENLEITVDAILDSMHDDIDILVILNPNNPAGNVYSYEEMDRIIERAKACEITILIDEAYFYFYPNSFLKYAMENDFVFVTRTFSKLFSLAGTRLGYVAGRKEGIALIQKMCTPHNVNAFAMRFAQAIIEDEDMLNELIRKQKDGKQYLIDSLRANGYEVNAKEGNFMFVKTKTDAEEVKRRLKEEKHILVKTYDGIKGFGLCLRVSTGEQELMQQFVDALIDVDR